MHQAFYLLSSPGVLCCPWMSGPSAKPSSISLSHSRDRWSLSSILQPEFVRWEKLTTSSFNSVSTMDRTVRYALRRRTFAAEETSQSVFLKWHSASPRVSPQPRYCVWLTAHGEERPFPSLSERKNWPLSPESPWSWRRKITQSLKSVSSFS